MDRGNKHKSKSSSWIFLLLICLCTGFMSIGYAKINAITSEITGTLLAEVQDGVFITDISYNKDNNANTEQSKMLTSYQTTANSKIVLSDTDPNSSITYSITIYNSSDISFSFLKTIYDQNFYDNENIIFELINLETDDTILSKEYLTFEITFKYKDGVIPSSDINELNCYLNFRFLHIIDYIGSTGTQYIDTEIKPDNNTTFEMSFSLTDIETEQALYGTRESMDSVSYNMFFYNLKGSSGFRLRWDENMTRTYGDLYYNEGSIIDVKRDTDKVVLSTNGSSVSIENSSESWSLTSSIYVFNINQQDSPETRYAKMKLYYLKIYQNEELVRDFVPTLDKNGIACLYDSVSNSYFYNKGTGEFEYSDGYKVCEYIESSGTQYIDTGIKADNTTKVQFIMSLNEVTDETQGIFGGRNDQGDSSFNMFMYKSQLRWDYNSSIQYPSHETTLIDATYISADGESVTVNDTVTEYSYTDTLDSNYNMYLFTVNNGGSPVYLNTGMKIYYFKIIQDEEVVRNFIPVVDEQNVACLYDLVSGSYFYNKGTGDFSIK